MAVTVVLTPVLQEADKCRFYQEIGGCYKGTIILKNSVPIRSIPFKCIFVRLEKALMRGKKREIPLALYIRLQYRFNQHTIIYFLSISSLRVRIIIDTRLETRAHILTRATGFPRAYDDIVQLTTISTHVIYSCDYFENV